MITILEYWALICNQIRDAEVWKVQESNVIFIAYEDKKHEIALNDVCGKSLNAVACRCMFLAIETALPGVACK